MLRKYLTNILASLCFCLSLSGCIETGEPKARLTMFVGIDVSGSFLNSRYFEDSLHFLSHYIYSHLNALGGLEKPHSLFVGSIGGAKPDEPKTLFPIQTFENRSVEQIYEKLKEIFPKDKSNPFTDYNAFFTQIANTVKDKKLMLKPISVVMISDGKPDVAGKKGKKKFRDIDFRPLEKLSRNVTLRLLYTDAVIGQGWKTLVPRRRVKVWTQDAKVMVEWKNPATFQPKKELAEKERFFAWVSDNVDFGVRSRRVD